MTCAKHTERHAKGCEGCRRYQRLYFGRREVKIANGTWLYPVPVREVRADIRKLIKSGMTQNEISRATTGVATADTICRIMSTPQRRPKMVQGAVAAAIRAVQPYRCAPLGLVDAEPTRRMIRAMAWLGHAVLAQAESSGVDSRTLWNIANDRPDGTPRQPYITPRVARDIRALYGKWSTERCAGGRSKTRTIAISKGWHGPLAWANIDDPKCRPDTRIDAARAGKADVEAANVEAALAGASPRDELTTAEAITVCAILLARRWSYARIGAWLRWGDTTGKQLANCAAFCQRWDLDAETARQGVETVIARIHGADEQQPEHALAA